MGEKKIKGEEKRQIVALAAVCGPLSIIIVNYHRLKPVACDDNSKATVDYPKLR